jgi:proteasome lid subunit RPN8/RPN11
MRVAKAALDAMVAHAHAEMPKECCGLLVGSGDRIDEAKPARNLENSPTRYLIDPEDHFAVLRDARAAGRSVRGAYHSHPRGPSGPSPTDVAESNDASLLHVIVSLERDPPTVQAYYVRHGAATPVDLDVF